MDYKKNKLINLNSKKISVNTTYAFIRFDLNYGSVLQAYALQRYLRERGHDVSIVRDYRANPKVLVRRLKRIKYFKYFCEKLKAQRYEQRFIKNNLCVSKNGYITYSGLVKHCPIADIHIAGSDQIWRNVNISRFLSYVPKDKVKLSYAASFGKPKLSDEMSRKIKPLLSEFDGLSVREISGEKILHDMGLEGSVLIDPTLLFNYSEYPYKEIVGTRKYAFGYFLNLKSQLDVPYKQIKEFCSRENIELKVTVPNSYPLFLKENISFPSVEEWLGIYKDADYIFTNTYHGCLFSIIFKKQFLVCLQGSGYHDENERFYSVLQMLHLQDRVMKSGDTVESLQKKISKKIDYESVYRIINQKRKETEKFFKRFGI